WPLLQNLPGLVLNYFGLSPSSILHALAYLSFVSFVGSMLLGFWTMKRKSSTSLALAGVLVMITSPLLWYSHSTFGEMPAAFLILAFTAACQMNAPSWLTVLLFVFAGTTKEVAFPFLAAIGLLCVLQAPPQSRKKRAVSLIVAALLTIAAT